jgi:hypothetical protein
VVEVIAGVLPEWQGDAFIRRLAAQGKVANGGVTASTTPRSSQTAEIGNRTSAPGRRG